MATFVLIHGAGDSAWYWHLVEPVLREHDHDVVSMDLPCEDDSAGLPEYARAVVDAVGGRTDLVLVAQSFGGFTAPLVCDRLAVDVLVFVAGMIPVPGEAPNDYWTNTRWAASQPQEQELDGQSDGEDSTVATFYHDVPPELAAEAMRRERRQSVARMDEPIALDSWPDVPTRFLLCRDDRLFPAPWIRRVANDRLGISPDEIDGGHCVALSRPRELAHGLEGYWLELHRPQRSRPRTST